MTKTPNWATRMQRAVSGRTLRTSDYVNPIWTFKLVYAILHDFPWCAYTSPTELRTMMDFFNSSGGGFDSFLLTDPSDSSVTGQVLQPATSAIATVNVPGGGGGGGYALGDTVYLNVGMGFAVTTAAFQVASLSGMTTGIATLTMLNPGAYTIIPGSTAAPLIGGSGSGAVVNLTWTTTVQLVRTLVVSGFPEAIIAPNNVSNLYFASAPQVGWTLDSTTGLITLPNPFTTTQPTITADFTYYFRVYFPDALDFEEIYWQMWQLRQVKLTSVVL